MPDAPSEARERQRTPAARLGELLCARGWLLAAAESLTAGRVQALVASVSGSSRWFAGGLCAYNIDQKVAILGVDRDTAAAVDCVSAEVARQMAAGARRLFGAPVALATTGYAEPWGPIPAPMAHVAVDVMGRVWERQVAFPGLGRVEAQQAVAAAAVDLAIEALEAG